jgi:hypothetical protein
VQSWLTHAVKIVPLQTVSESKSPQWGSISEFLRIFQHSPTKAITYRYKNAVTGARIQACKNDVTNHNKTSYCKLFDCSHHNLMSDGQQHCKYYDKIIREVMDRWGNPWAWGRRPIHETVTFQDVKSETDIWPQLCFDNFISIFEFSIFDIPNLWRATGTG